MIDLHIHSTYSDGTTSVEDILKICEDKKLEYISITDHNTCKAYSEEIFNKRIFSGKVIKGAEMNATFQKKNIEILAYDIKDSEIIENWSKKFFSESILKEQQEKAKRKLLEICDKKGLIYDESKIKEDIPLTDYITIYIYYELIRHKENHKILGEFADSLNIFVRKGLMNPESDYYTGDDDLLKPRYKDVVDVVHEAGGKAFLAHPFEYRFNNTIEFIEKLRKEKELDGIECFHPSAEENNKSKILIEYAQENNLYICGGSDYHGSKKPNIEIGIGGGTLNIDKKYIEKWIN